MVTATRQTTTTRQLVIDRTAGGSSIAPKEVATWLGQWHRYCPRCGTGRIFVTKSLSSDGGKWVVNCINCGYEKDIP